jgi:hypothetical protein
MSSEPECRCPMARNGGIDHRPDCMWTAWKNGETVISSKFDVSKVSEGIFATGGIISSSPKGQRFHDLNVSRLVVRDTMRMAAPTSRILIDEIRQNGVLKPIVVKDLKNGYYEIQDGIERFKAVILLGYCSIPGYIT